MTSDRPLKIYGIVSTLAILALVLMGAEGSSDTTVFDTITVRHIDVVASEGRVRVQLAGEYGPRRKDLAGLLSHNEGGHEAGGWASTRIFIGRSGEAAAFDTFLDGSAPSWKPDHTAPDLEAASQPDRGMSAGNSASASG